MPRWFTILLLVVLGLVAVALALGRPYSRKPLDDFVAAEKKAGRPTTIRAAIGPDPAAEENGAPALTAAARDLDQRAGDISTWGVVGPWKNDGDRPWFDTATPEDLAALGRFVEAQRAFFDGVAAALAKPRLRTEMRQEADGAPAPGDILGQVRVLHLLEARAIAAPGADARLESIALLLSFAGRSEVVSLLDEIVAGLAQDWALQALRRGLQRHELDAEAARARLDPLLRTDWVPRFPGLVRRECAWYAELLARPERPEQASFVGLGGEAMFERLVSRVRSLVEGPRSVSGTPEDLAAGMRAVSSLEALPTADPARLALAVRSVRDAQPEGTSCRLMVENFVWAAERLVRSEAAQRLARIALAAAAHRARTGALPVSLDDLRDALGGDAPLDPFTGAAFDFAATPDGIRISTDGRLPGTAAPRETRLSDAPLVWELKR